MTRLVKIAVLFRGPIRPSVASTAARVSDFMQQFRGLQNATVSTWLTTWRTWRDQRAADLLAQDLFDHVIMQTEPTDAQIQRATQITQLPNGADIRPVFNQYHQSKLALDLICQTDDFDYIVHTRTDLQMQLGPYIGQWFDPQAYAAPHVPGVAAPHAPHIQARDMWICDQFGVAPAAMMHAAWNHGSISELGQRIAAADKPEAVLQHMMAQRSIPVKAPPWVVWQLDPARNS
jgi:hypothetical protein